jgi:hypothetical protein
MLKHGAVLRLWLSPKKSYLGNLNSITKREESVSATVEFYDADVQQVILAGTSQARDCGDVASLGRCTRDGASTGTELACDSWGVGGLGGAQGTGYNALIRYSYAQVVPWVLCSDATPRMLISVGGQAKQVCLNNIFHLKSPMVHRAHRTLRMLSAFPTLPSHVRACVYSTQSGPALAF